MKVADIYFNLWKRDKTSTEELVQKACHKDSDKTDPNSRPQILMKAIDNHHHNQIVIQPLDKETPTHPTFDPSPTATRILTLI